VKPLLAKAGVRARGKVVIGTIEGDLHDIGKDLVAMMLEGAGFGVVNLGVAVTRREVRESSEGTQAQYHRYVCAINDNDDSHAADYRCASTGRSSRSDKGDDRRGGGYPRIR